MPLQTLGEQDEPDITTVTDQTALPTHVGQYFVTIPHMGANKS